MDNMNKKLYLNRLENTIRLLIKFADMRLRNDVQQYIEENYQELNRNEIFDLETMYEIKAFSTREDLDAENKLLRDVDIEWSYANTLLDQDATFDEMLDLLVPAFPKTKWVLEDISAIDYYVNHVEPKAKEVKNVATIRKLRKHTRRNVKSLRRVLAAINKARKDLEKWEPETLVSIYTDVVGNK